jgi:hypothetical protein
MALNARVRPRRNRRGRRDQLRQGSTNWGQQARRLQESGRHRGRAWRPIIEGLGFDPRSFTGPKGSETLTLGSEGGRLIPGHGTLRPGQPGGGGAPGNPPAPAEPAGQEAGPPDVFSAALERMRASGLQGYEANRRAFDEGMQSLHGRFFDPVNQYSEASQIALADKIARKKSLNAGAASGQLFSGSMINAENLISDQTGRATNDMQQRYQEMVADLTRDRMDRDADIRSQLEAAEFDYAGMIGGDPEGYTDIPPEAAARKARGRVHPTKTKDHGKAGLKKVGKNTYRGPNGTFWHRTKNGTFARGKG